MQCKDLKIKGVEAQISIDSKDPKFCSEYCTFFWYWREGNPTGDSRYGCLLLNKWLETRDGKTFRCEECLNKEQVEDENAS